MSTLAIVGGGSWGTALSIALAPRFEEIRLWVHDPALAQVMAQTRENTTYLPGFALPSHVAVYNGLPETVANAQFVLGVMPSAHARSLYRQLRPLAAPAAVFISATKGLERHTLHRMSTVMREELGPTAPIVVLSGPGFAREIAAGDPAALVVASEDSSTASGVQSAFATPRFRPYTNPDPTGVEIGAALKNIIAIAAGVCEGLGLGNNTLAALITRGLAEITRLAVALGGQPQTLAGLAGLGDLVLTCNGALSRNRRLGIALAQGHSLERYLAETKMVVEGVETTSSAVELATRTGIEVPIIHEMSAVLREGKAPRQAIRDLMDRSLKGEY